MSDSFTVPSLTGKTWLITGANRGLGLEATRRLALAGARVLMGCRDVETGAAARDALMAEHGALELEVVPLDLADLASVAACADAVLKDHGALSGLLNNAGVMAIPFGRTVDGFELHMGINHLGHFALTLRCLPALIAGGPSRVVTVSSNAHKWQPLKIGANAEAADYSRWGAYTQSKLANVLFSKALERRLRSAGAPVEALGCHPGYVSTQMQFSGSRASGAHVELLMMRLGDLLVAQSIPMGALPLLYAAACPEAVGGGYYGPDGPLELWGGPIPVEPSRHALNTEAAQALWCWSAAQTGVDWR